ncbi:MAG: AlkZ family DNA glycosylase [Chloroflexi bacterium]|nr:AlkZ family DNA glycosylase [Chloroflexota bacterium]
MDTLNIPLYRLHNQRLLTTAFKTPGEVVAWLGAVQAQDYAGAKWAVALRANGLTDEAVERAFIEGKILRTHVMRPTWHFVTPKDIRWMLMLTAPRVHAISNYYYRKSGLDAATFKKSNSAIAKALKGGRQLTRNELASALQKAGIPTDADLRLTYLVMYAELEGLICSGARRGKQFTYALLEERVPPAKPMKRDEALAELVRRYFSTRGPATLQDFAWWSGLTVADAKVGIEMVRPQFVSETINGQTYWLDESNAQTKLKSPTAYLLPNYDEYFIGFKDRSAFAEVIRREKLEENNPAFIAHVIVLNGQVVGGWKRTLKKDSVLVELSLITKLSKTEYQAVVEAANRFGKFLGLSVELVS